MSKQIFFFGCMNASKSAQLLMQNYNYREQGSHTLLVKPAIDTRDGLTKISSRIGLKEDVDYMVDSDTSANEIRAYFGYLFTKPDVILIDESQFLTTEQVDAFSTFSRVEHIELHAFGLMTNFQNELFEGSKRWLETSDNIVEIKTTCSKCTRKATCNLRLNDGKPVYDGDVVQIGGNESYVSVCREHYYNYGD